MGHMGHEWVIHRSRMDHVGHTGQPLVVFGLAMGTLGHMCHLGHTKPTLAIADASYSGPWL